MSCVFKFIRIIYICLLTKVIKNQTSIRSNEKLVVSKSSYELFNEQVLCNMDEQINFYTKKLYVSSNESTRYTVGLKNDYIVYHSNFLIK